MKPFDRAVAEIAQHTAVSDAEQAGLLWKWFSDAEIAAGFINGIQYGERYHADSIRNVHGSYLVTFRPSY